MSQNNFGDIKQNYENFVNVFLGQVDFTAQDVDERAKEGITGPSLDGVEYVVDVHAKKDALRAMIQDVAIKYADAGVDFDVLADNTDHRNVKSIQEATGRSFNFHRAVEVMGRMPAMLRGKFTQSLDAGADNVQIDSAEQSGMSSYHDMDGEAIALKDLNVEYKSLDGTAAYDDKNVACAALAKALSAQMEGTGGDENLLRLMIEPEDYMNLLCFTLQGAKNNDDANSNPREALGELICSKESPQGEEMTLDEAIDNNDMSAPNSRALGHEILLAMFAQENPNPHNCGVQSEDKLYAHDGDLVRIQNSELVQQTVNLQFVVETELTLKLRDSAGTFKTRASPSELNNNKVRILFNVIFDREDDANNQITIGGYEIDVEEGDITIDTVGGTIITQE